MKTPTPYAHRDPLRGGSVPRCQPEVVYALVDPRDDAVRYVGVTCNLEGRLKGHLEANPDEGRARALWIRELRALRLKPRVVVLEDIGAPDLEGSHEARWIELWRRAGSPLLNVHKPAWRGSV